MSIIKEIIREVTHDELIEEGIQILKTIGFNDSEIETEYSYYFNYERTGSESKQDPVLRHFIGDTNDNIHRYIIDVVGIRIDDSVSIAIECGKCDALKIARIKTHCGFDQVILLPYHKIVITGQIIEEAEQLRIDNQEKREKYINLRFKYERIQRLFKQLSNELKAELKHLE